MKVATDANGIPTGPCCDSSCNTCTWPAGCACKDGEFMKDGTCVSCALNCKTCESEVLTAKCGSCYDNFVL
jgi:hypothetical protein